MIPHPVERVRGALFEVGEVGGGLDGVVVEALDIREHALPGLVAPTELGVRGAQDIVDELGRLGDAGREGDSNRAGWPDSSENGLA